MRVLLTGGSGSVGKAVVDRLTAQGHGVLVVGRRPGLEIEGAEYRSCDINNYASLREVIRGCQAVVHLAAIPNPVNDTPEQIFTINCAGTFNVFQAAAEEGIKRVVQASSINATGQFFGIGPLPLYYLPMDEDHPVSSTDAYSFSKHVVEEIGEFFWRRDQVSSLALRLPYVAPASYRETLKTSRKRIQGLVERLSQMSPAERRLWFDQAWARYNTFRAARPYEEYGKVRELINAMPDDEKAAFSAMTNRVNFFTMVDERDSAQAIVRGLTAEFSGAHTLFVNDKINWTGVESDILVEYFYPDVPGLKKPLAGTETLVSIERARQLIGYDPEYPFEEE